MRGAERERRNRARVKGCRLHSFDCSGALEREKEKREKFGVSIPLFPIAIRCRCKNCGGTMSLMYAIPYMEALRHAHKQGGKHEKT